MPFDPNKPPAKLKNLSDKQKRQWVDIFNSCWEKHHNDKKCHKMAWGGVKKASINVGCPSCMMSDNENPDAKDAPCWAGELISIAKDLLR
jgi:hypothetical protein